MKRRQTVPRTWLVADERLGADLWTAIRKLPPGSGLLLLYREMPKGKRARLKAKLRRVAAARRLTIADELAGEAARVHDSREIRAAGLRRVPLLFLSPLFETRSHPDWRPLPRMRAAALARLAKAPVLALGGMTAQRFARVSQLGFQGWAGIDAFRT
jgi:thiamine-phosphate pyrophosphorylase